MSKLLGIVILSLSCAAVSVAHDGRGFDRIDHGGEFFQRDGDRGGSFAAPEIDPASALSAFTMLAGGLAVLRSRIGRK